MSSGKLMEHVHELCDVIGPRPAGSEAEEVACSYLVEQFRNCGLVNVAREPFDAPHWTRGRTSAALISPVARPIRALALPMNLTHSLEADVVWAPFETEEEFERMAPAIRGKVVLNQAAAKIGMSGAMLHRSDRIRMAADAGAEAFLWMANRPGQLLPTGSMDPKIARRMPAFGISLEDGELVRRLLDAHEEPVRLRIETENSLETKTSWNVSGEVGAGDGDLVLVTAHYDSHDITVGAFDNAAGTAIVLECARALARHYADSGPRIRFVIFSAEEVGLAGSRSYVEQHASEIADIRFMINADGLGAIPSTKYVHVPFRPDLAAHLEGIFRHHGYSVEVEEALALNWDHAPFALEGVPVASITAKWKAGTLLHYGHTASDTPEKLDPQDLRYAASCVALLATRIALDADWPLEHLDARDIEKKLEGVGPRLLRDTAR